MFSKKFSSIYFFLVYFSWTFWNPRPNFSSSPSWSPSGLFSVALKLFELSTYKLQSIIVKYTYGTLVWISPLDRAPGHFGQGIIVIKLILVDFDGYNANITLKICTDVVYIHVYAV